MPTRVRVLSRVAIWGVITTKRHTTCLTRAQVDPAGADFDALFTFPARRVLDLGNGVYMRTTISSHVPPLFGEHLMYERHRNRTFPDGGRYSFQIPATNISDSEHTAQTRFQEIRQTLKGPLGFRQIIRREI